ncbi:MAG TPA: DUF2520 domain-containing protein [Candidatus Limnocylindrales bacterium]|nr:DUF2520 domain-containing protein [Candidatus Limnocylindrales bacterium]
MKAWRGAGGKARPAASDPSRPPDEATLADLRRRGIELDPGHAQPHDAADDHEQPDEHQHRDAGVRPLTGIVGAGAVGTALGGALSRAGWPVAAVASRDAGRRDRFRTFVPGARAYAEANALLDDVELVILAVPDDVIPGLAGELHLYSGQAMVHTSGALGAEVLEPAMAAGTQVGAFHPLVAFADTERAIAAFNGAMVAIEGDDQLAELLAEMAEAIGATAVRLTPGSKAAYHAAAVLSAGGFVALLDAIAELGRVAGLDEAGSLAIYGGLIEQTLGNARALGISRALTGPVTRGDVGTLRRHLAAMAEHAPDALALYAAAAEREIALAADRGSITPEVAAAMRDVLAGRK